MNQNLSQNTLQIIEVPQELRGMTDEEIIQNSERIKKDFSGSRKNGAARPSKRDRLALKTKQAHQEIQDLAAEIFGNKQPAPSPVEVLKLNPEKQGSVFDPKFEKKWLDSNTSRSGRPDSINLNITKRHRNTSPY